HRGQIIFVVGRLTINPGAANDTCDLWLDPSPFAFGVSEANVPAPDVADVGGSAPDIGNVDFFWIKNTVAPASRRFTDLRIGTTWASVTPPAPPNLSLANVALPPGVTKAVLASQNVGNPVDCGSFGLGYQWQLNGGPPLTDGGTISGSSMATLTITGVTAADLGTYTVTGTSTDPLNSYSDPFATPPVTGDRVFNPTGTNWIGSASAVLSFAAPPLSVVYSPPNASISWPTNWTGYTLENRVALNPSNWVTNWPPPYTVAGTNYTQSVPAASGTEFFRLIK
ncbi:MAG: immunoglobulin domain-containing protein, partial [Methanothrix sp.]|nr:immunoglobulin domain-containing protein [Methanothrix sp.]